MSSNNTSMPLKWPIIILVLGLVAFAGLRVWETWFSGNINSFEDCVNAGYPILESYPEQCIANGQNFINSRN